MQINTVISSFAASEALISQLGPVFAERAAWHDASAEFVSDNYRELKEHRFFSLLVPQELGGQGLRYDEVCRLLSQMAGYCASTALALSMHQHVVAANVWKYQHGKGGEAVLKRVAAEQLILVSTGGRDWLESGGIMEKTEGGFLVSGKKFFASQSPVGDVMATSSVYEDPENGPQVLHFGIPFKAEGVSLLDDWDSLGMRGTGSQTIQLDKVFVPETAVQLRRPRGVMHPVWDTVLGNAIPLIMAAYYGIAQKAYDTAIDLVRAGKRKDLVSLIGELYNQHELAKLLMDDLIDLNDNFTFAPSNTLTQKILSRKSMLVDACMQTVRLSMEVCGGRAFRKGFELERLFRDIQASHFHPLPKREQFVFSGNSILQNA